MMRIAVLDDWQGLARASADWSALEAKAEVVFFRDTLKDEEALVERLAPFDILMTMRERTRFPASLIERLPRLRMLNITGMRNGAVDIAALQRRGVVVSRTEAGESGEATAELTLCLLLSAARRVPLGEACVRAGRFQEGVPLGFTLRGKTLGLVGLGRLGTLMAGYGRALGMRVLAWSPNLTEDRAAAAGAAFATKEDLFSQADAVSLHMVLSDRSRGLVGASELARMKPGAILVNTSRSPLIDGPALVDALHRGAIVAALDVFDEEPLPLGHPLLSTPNTVLSPHLGYSVRENFSVFHRQAVENVLAFLAGSPIRPMPAPE